jgi:hypothetical protein
MTDFLVDTDVLVDISKGNPDAADFVDALPGGLFISRVSAMELIIGARDKREQMIIEGFISQYQIKELSDSIGQEAYRYVKQYAKSHGLALADALIAATAIGNDLTLVSRNEKHFRPIRGLKFLKAKY